MDTQSKAYKISLELYAQACMKGLMRKVTLEQYSEFGYEKIDTGHKAKYIPESIVVVETSVFDDLSPRATKLALRMLKELHMNNALWYFENQNTADSTAVKELREKQILFKTENPHIHFVNPSCIRKGSKPGVLACTTNELKGINKVSISNIRALGYRSSLNLLSLPDPIPTLLE